VGYVAVRGGEDAIRNSEALLVLYRRGGGSAPLQVRQILEQMRLAVDRVMAEGSLYEPTLAALAVKQAEGDLAEAAFLVRAYRSTLPRLQRTPPLPVEGIRLIRRISAAFRDIPGGQILGPTRDYTQRLLDFSLLEDEAEAAPPDPPRVSLNGDGRETPERVSAYLRQEGLLPEPPPEAEPPADITRDAVAFPLPRSARLQALARGEEGGMLALAYSSMRGFGSVHPTVAELRVGYLAVQVSVPDLDAPVTIGEILVTEVELISRSDLAEPAGAPQFSLGYGFAFGHNERRAICMAILDRAMRAERVTAPAQDQEFVLQHIEGIEAQGFTNHWKLPHYVDFQAELEQLRSLRTARGAERPMAAPAEVPA
jgi:alpha-D-ribose 1-methylphosphonate 5-triphosphate synthase subunit PhnI